MHSDDANIIRLIPVCVVFRRSWVAVSTPALTMVRGADWDEPHPLVVRRNRILMLLSRLV